MGYLLTGKGFIDPCSSLLLGKLHLNKISQAKQTKKITYGINKGEQQLHSGNSLAIPGETCHSFPR